MTTDLRRASDAVRDHWEVGRCDRDEDDASVRCPGRGAKRHCADGDRDGARIARCGPSVNLQLPPYLDASLILFRVDEDLVLAFVHLEN
ncbi:hypothetical protein HDU67_009082, partial [Dinochytrium kinnereticum]